MRRSKRVEESFYSFNSLSLSLSLSLSGFARMLNQAKKRDLLELLTPSKNIRESCHGMIDLFFGTILNQNLIK